MARCVKRLENDILFYNLMDWYLNGDNKVRKEYEDWQDRAIYKVTRAFTILKLQEMKVFLSNKSYFKSLESKETFSKDDRDYLSISDELKVKI
jgi:hypothetical protein